MRSSVAVAGPTVQRTGSRSFPIASASSVSRAVVVVRHAKRCSDTGIPRGKRKPHPARRDSRRDAGKAQCTQPRGLRDLTSGVTGNVAEDSWALDISFKATKGIGFREIWYLELSERQLRMKHAWAPRLEQPPLDPQFTGLFSAPNDTIDLSSLHWAITDLNPDTGRAEECNIHIDQVGITASLGSGVSVTPDLVYHTLVELAFRTGLKGYLPDYMLQRINFILPSSHENFAANFGVEYTPIKRDDLRFISCPVQSLRRARLGMLPHSQFVGQTQLARQQARVALIPARAGKSVSGGNRYQIIETPRRFAG